MSAGDPLVASWRVRFREALGPGQPAALDALLDEHAQTVGHSAEQALSDDPLRLAVASLSPWAVQHVLAHHHAQSSLALGNMPSVLQAFFDQSRLKMKVPLEAKLAVWQALLPAVLESVGTRQHALAYYLQALKDTRQFPQGMTWESLQMDRVGEGLWALGYPLECPEETMTPLQRAWRASAFEAMERLLDHGVRATEPDPGSLLPDWTLQSTVNAMRPQQLGPEWAGLVARLKAVELDAQLPAPTPGKRSPRF